MSLKQNAKTRMIDIARKVGVSKGAVSSVLNDVGRNVIRVSAAKREEILRVAKEMNYVPNMTARALAGRSGMKIGVLIDSHAPRCTYRILWSIEESAVKAGYRLMIGQAHDDPQSLFDCYENFLCHDIDGVICLAYEYPNRKDEVRAFFQGRRNLIFHDPPEWEAPYVKIDRETGIMAAMRHLQETGRERIGLWLPDEKYYYSDTQRIAGYRKCNRGEDLVRFGITPENYVREIRSRKLDAVLAYNDVMAAKLTRELLRAGIRIPQDVALVGHDNDDFSEYCYPSLSTIDQKDEAAGQRMFELLMAQLKGENDPDHETFDTRLIVRESSAGVQDGTSQNNHLSLHTARKKEGDTNGGNLKKQTGFMRKVSGSIKEKELEK